MDVSVYILNAPSGLARRELKIIKSEDVHRHIIVVAEDRTFYEIRMYKGQRTWIHKEDYFSLLHPERQTRVKEKRDRFYEFVDSLVS